LLVSGELVEVQQLANARGAPSWKLWTRERALSAGMAIIEFAPEVAS
jgi:hypothetical protein